MARFSNESEPLAYVYCIVARLNTGCNIVYGDQAPMNNVRLDNL